MVCADGVVVEEYPERTESYEAKYILTTRRRSQAYAWATTVSPGVAVHVLNDVEDMIESLVVAP